jgi:hypothetical protein
VLILSNKPGWANSGVSHRGVDNSIMMTDDGHSNPKTSKKKKEAGIFKPNCGLSLVCCDGRSRHQIVLPPSSSSGGWKNASVEAHHHLFYLVVTEITAITLTI